MALSSPLGVKEPIGSVVYRVTAWSNSSMFGACVTGIETRSEIRF